MSEEKTYTLEECKNHNTEKDCWLVIQGKVYDVTEFLEEHPGGFDVIISSTGKDATRDFEDVGHSKTAKKQLETYYIGKIENSGAESEQKEEEEPEPVSTKTVTIPFYQRLIHVTLPFIFLFIAVVYNYYFQRK
uniref:Cytochrome b5 heme-binding domain-containing protein n=1 Tax=Polytomella parva TaxID=51329 RepID=A0A7S0VAG2_9CHLO|nr:CER1-CER3 alkane-forming complex cyt-b5 component (CER1) [Polytomella parva]|mmetsp:Transcript_34191/g.61661  ORF Transcript_34191/g.61661 Transcript_34191/m.61661 type:complete len:134 (+) Transcript_34191:52-453(+)|eukprot:CAMPEP_0175064526 /NCGR_PEP_ID=MMETSP0052_2-20121109/15387_1 /TAXON_ID=51329 ORGANISM="Polytomella parva, Strain SAG 63-3" /NCGR_SAMPLE_ID=MMETSP0052_2 /ASSEMBLY_ACC=CAM_ASM_000194 /LENGTH=133 /DNA_ID=CAMNT_0016330897 /DNA_START=17 /DNA_END=418 /DNA_ORIENTATION=-